MSVNLFKFLRNSKGATAVEYSLIAALVSVALFAGLSNIGNVLAQLFGIAAVDVASTSAP